MANTFITPSIIAREALMHLEEGSVVLPLVGRNFEQDFQGKQGDTITVRQPATLTVDEFSRAAGIVVQDVTETSFTVTMDKLLDVSVSVDAEDFTLEVPDFSQKIVQPVMQAFIADIDTRLIAALQAPTGGGTGRLGASPVVELDETVGATLPDITAARKALNVLNVPMAPRHAVWGPDQEEELLNLEVFSHAEKSGSTAALREAELGRVRGFNHYTTNRIPDPAASPPVGDPNTQTGVGFHPSTVTLVSRTLARPLGASSDNVATMSAAGLGLRVVQGYDMQKKVDTISFDVLVGVAVVDYRRKVLIHGLA